MFHLNVHTSGFLSRYQTVQTTAIDSIGLSHVGNKPNIKHEVLSCLESPETTIIHAYIALFIFPRVSVYFN